MGLVLSPMRVRASTIAAVVWFLVPVAYAQPVPVQEEADAGQPDAAVPAPPARPRVPRRDRAVVPVRELPAAPPASTPELRPPVDGPSEVRGPREEAEPERSRTAGPPVPNTVASEEGPSPGPVEPSGSVAVQTQSSETSSDAVPDTLVSSPRRMPGDGTAVEPPTATTSPSSARPTTEGGPAAPFPNAGSPREVVQYVPFPVPESAASLEEWVPGIPDWARGTVGSALVLLVLLLAASAGLRWARRHLPEEGVIPSAARFLEVMSRLLVASAVVIFTARLLWDVAGDAYKWILVAASLAVGWSVRDVLPDLVAAAVLRFEAKVRPGIWIAGEGFEGVVERRALRAVWLKDPAGDRVAIPNRRLMQVALRVQDGMGAVHDVPVRLASSVPAALARQAILEAVVTSPYVAPDVRAAVRRDGGVPDLWHVRASLLDERYAMAFEGELLERVEAVLEGAFASQSLDPGHG